MYTVKERFQPPPHAISVFTDQAVHLMRRPEIKAADWLSTYKYRGEFAQVVDTLDPRTLGVFLIATGRQHMNDHTPGLSMESAMVGFSTLSRIKAVDDARRDFSTSHPDILTPRIWDDFQEKLILHESTGKSDDKDEVVMLLRTLWGIDTPVADALQGERNTALMEYLALVLENLRRTEPHFLLYRHAREAEEMGATRQALDKLMQDKGDMLFYNSAHMQSLGSIELLYNSMAKLQ